MLTVILTILKIIGITLAVLVGLILLFVLLVGFVPVRYKASGEYPAEGELKEDVISRRKRDALMNKVKAPELEEGEKPEEEKKPLAIKADAVVSWLLHIVHISVHVDSTGYIATARLFGIFKIYSNDPETVRKKEEKRKKKEEKQRKKEEKARLKAEKKGTAKQEEKKTEESDEIKQITTSKESNPGKKDAEEQKKIEDKTDTAEKESGADDKDREDNKKTGKDDKDDYDIFSSMDEDDADDEGVSQKGIVNKIKKIYNKLVSIHKKYRYVMDLKDDKRVRSGISYAKEKLFLVIKRVLPKKLEGRIAYGMEDPATTGYITGGVCLFYGLWCRNLSLEPDFENKKLEADINLKGRLVMALLVIPAIKVWFNKDIKYIRRKVDKLKKM